MTACRAFDTQYADASQATGFVVDKRRGIILTNPHVVSRGPVVAEAVFVNREEIPVYPIYRDPVSPELYGDSYPRFFTYWTTDAYQTTGCYNLLCSGFVQTNNRISIGATISPRSSYKGKQFDIGIMIWKVHDFGFFRFDPAAIKYLSYEEIPLAPEAASVGLEIRVIGNDSGEKGWLQ